MIDFSKRIRKAKKGRPDTLRREAAKQGWYSAEAHHKGMIDDFPSNPPNQSAPPDSYTDIEQRAYVDGRDLAIDVFYEVGSWDTKHPFGEIDNPKVPI